VIAALSFSVLLFMVALAVDVGNLILQRRQLLQIAEMAALTGAQEYDDTNRAYPIIQDPDGVDGARAYVLLRGILCPGPDCDVARIAADTSIGCLNNNECLRVTVRRRVEFAFARGLGVPSQLVTATATARAGRELPHRAGIITTGIDSHSGLDVMDGPAGTVQVVGDVVSNDLFNVHGASRLNLAQGRAFLPPSGTLTGGGNVTPGPPTRDAGLYDSQTDLPDPIEHARRHGQVTFPAAPGSWSSCATTRTVPEQANDPPIPPDEPDDVTVTLDPGLNVIVEEEATAILRPGNYCNITVRDEGNIEFLPGNYTINGTVLFEEDAYGFFGNGEYIVRNDLALSGDAFIEGRRANAGDGIYMQVLGNVDASEQSSYTLKGKPERYDILFHIPIAQTGRVVRLMNTTSSEIIGTIYVPGRDSYVDFRGNAAGGYRVTNGPAGATLRGGRIIAYHVHVYPPISGGTGFAVNYPMNSPDYVREPRLVRSGT
jgi:hypothetical protein